MHMAAGPGIIGLIYLEVRARFSVHSGIFRENLAGMKEFHNSKIESQKSLYKASGAFPFLYMSKKLVKL